MPQVQGDVVADSQVGAPPPQSQQPEIPPNLRYIDRLGREHIIDQPIPPPSAAAPTEPMHRPVNTFWYFILVDNAVDIFVVNRHLTLAFAPTFLLAVVLLIQTVGGGISAHKTLSRNPLPTPICRRYQHGYRNRLTIKRYVLLSDPKHWLPQRFCVGSRRTPCLRSRTTGRFARST